MITEEPIVKRTTKEQAGNCQFCMRARHTVFVITASNDHQKTLVRMCEPCLKAVAKEAR